MRAIFLTFFFAIFCFVTPVMAQEGNDLAINEDNVSDLIGTLESEEKRQEFIDNLKALVKADEEINDDPSLEPVTEALGIEKGFSKLMGIYENFLAENNLNGTTVGKTAVTIITFVVLMLFLFIVRKGGVYLRDKVLAYSNNLGLTHGRFRLYARVIRYFGYFLVVSLFVYTLSIIWEFMDFAFIKGEFLGDILGVALVAITAITIWEVFNSFLENKIHNADREERNRLRTLLPIIRNVAFIVFSVMFALVMLSELGIDILPLLAGAGILGIAIGFGAQTVVKDFLTGFTIILEDLIQVGDVASLGGKIGLIEKITIRKVQLRDLAGIVYTVPFSDIGVIENWTKDFSFYSLDVGVAYREDTDEVVKLLKEVDEDLRSDDKFKNLILEPIEVLGVDAFADSAVIIKARIKTKPIRQWDVGREFNRRMKYKFDEHGIEIPFPHQTIYFGEDKQGNAPSAAIRLMDQQSK